ncbi:MULTISPECIES: TIGR02234 family membrane protein [Streptomyces]|uniref:Membrane protein n=1 Tax=Streptomyces hydrogenans TaxID=1873719 RepID=A0ABQ3P9B0_9ACTN|nr:MULTISPECIES: TIGR02234 family membrane protein [Streptomyces]MCM1948792.1 TIGR02234 family membrane protein [Streptomyces sp. G2]GHG05824.1 membrane protein [Streptomyces hydrogenans]GHI21602.1 membrane protein [Streptomyces hydrogenans]GHJ95564.1 membrane protein [Streptomyces sp. NE5-10]
MSAVPVPQPRAARAAVTSGGRRSLALALLLGALGATVVLLSAGQIWAEGTASVAGGTVPVEADGGTVTGVPTALAIVGLAALVAVFAVRRAGRTLVAGLLALSGAGAALAAFLGASDSDALDAEAARISGDTAAAVAGLTHTAWPYVAAAGALLILVAGLFALRYGKSWPAMGGRYERSGAPRPGRRPAAGDPDRPEDLWKALDRGEDPTHDA